MRPLKVAMVGLRAPWGAEGGVEFAVGELAPRLVDLGCEVTVYCRRRYNPYGTGVRRGVQLVDVDTIYSRSLEAPLHTLLATPRAAMGADIVHVHAMGPALFSFVPRALGCATVVTVHAVDYERRKWGVLGRGVLRAGTRSATRYADQLITVGQHLQKHVVDNYDRQSTWIPNGVGEIADLPLSEGGVDGLESGRFLLYVGRIVPEKGLERLMRAYRQANIDIPLVIAGGATHMELYLRSLRRLAPPGVIFTGSLDARRRDALLRHARAFVLASEIEGFPLAPLEAMACARPVLLSDIAPHHELLAGQLRGSAGWIVPDGRWAAALRRVCDAPDAQLRAMGAQGEAHVRAHYSWENIAERTLRVYRAALAKR